MATLYHEGNKDNVFGPGGGPAGGGSAVEDECISKTKELAFPMGEQISLENFEHKGDRPAGTIQALSDMVTLTGKELQASYRSGLPESMKYTQKVDNR